MYAIRSYYAAKWRLRSTVPEAEARVPDLPKLQAASAQAAGNPVGMVQQGLSTLGNLAQMAQKSGGGVSPEAGGQVQPRATRVAGGMASGMSGQGQMERTRSEGQNA